MRPEPGRKGMGLGWMSWFSLWEGDKAAINTVFDLNDLN